MFLLSLCGMNVAPNGAFYNVVVEFTSFRSSWEGELPGY